MISDFSVPALFLSIPICLLLTIPSFVSAEEGSSDQDVIVISADRNTQDTHAGQKTTITQEEWERRGARTVLDVVELSSGVTVARSGTSLEPATISIRGSGGEQVLVMVNGIPLNNGQGDSVNLNSLGLGNVTAIEVIRGGNSAVYGEGAFGGVINIITEDDLSLIPEGDIYASIGSFETFTGVARVRGPLNRSASLSGNLSIDGRSTGGEYDYPGTDGTLTRVNADGWSVQGAGGMQWNAGGMDRNIFSLDLEAYGSGRGVPGIMEYLTPEARMAEARVLGSLGWTWHSWSDFILDTGFFLVDQFSSFMNPEESIDEDHHNISLGGRLNASIPLDLGVVSLKPVFGTELSVDSLESSGLQSSTGTVLPGEASQRALSIYARIDTVFRSFFLIPAVRWDYFETGYVGWSERTDQNTSWSVTAGYEPWASGIMSFKGNVGTAFHAPGFDDLFWSGGSFASGNPDLLPEESFNWDIGMSISPWKGFDGNIVYYQTKAENLIQWVPTPGGTWKPVNIGEAEIEGIESDLTWLIPIIRKKSFFFELSGAYTWLSAKDQSTGSINKGNQLPYRPEHSGTGSLSLILKDHSLTFAGRYMGYRFTNAANTKYFDPVIIFDAGLKIVLPAGFYTRCFVRNLANVYYVDKLGYPVPGRELTVTGGYSF